MMLDVELTAPQSDFFRLRDHCDYPLFVGGYGSGKTYALQMNAIWDCLDNGAVKVATYAPTYDLLNLNLIPRVAETLTSMGLSFGLNKSSKIFTIEGGSELICRSMDRPERIIAYEVYRSHIDEIDTLRKDKADDIFLKVIARNRQIVKGKENVIACYTTPDHGFSSFTYNRWGKRKQEGHAYVRAPTESNAKNTVEGYSDKLRKVYSKEVADAYVAGIWCNITTGVVYRMFDRKRNCSLESYIPGELVFIGMDFNVGKMAVVVYVLRKGSQMHAVMEMTDGKDTPDAIKWIQRELQSKGSKVFVYPDATGNARKSTDASRTDIALLKAAGFVVMSGATNPRVRDRVLSANKAFEDLKVMVNPLRCPVFAECLEQQVYADNGDPDKTAGMDHSNDAGTYPIAIRFPIRKPVSSGRTSGV